VRKVKEGETTNQLFAFLTTAPNAEVRAIHPKAMPVVLTKAGGIRDVEDGMGAEGLEATASPAGWIFADLARGAKQDERSMKTGMTIKPPQSVGIRASPY
jgi:hypothetical protein